jgi:hypothetical protein
MRALWPLFHSFLRKSASPHLSRGTRRAATDEKSRDAVALDRHCNCNAKGIDPRLQKKIERLLGWPERNLSSPLDRRARKASG